MNHGCLQWHLLLLVLIEDPVEQIGLLMLIGVLVNSFAATQDVAVDGMAIDRCTICKGIWFDAGEVEVLRNKKAAAAIDTGDAGKGKNYNVIDSYACPRCGESMAKVVNPQQRHIWYETCSKCEGSFFDAGEFLDLSQLTISDLFKRLVTPNRN